jgi:homoserine dehydrogenase
MPALDIFKNEVEAFLTKTGMAPTTFGTKAIGDAMFMQKLRGGREPRINTAEKIRKFMKSFKRKR